jgi:argininosuccinate lyase
VAFVERDFRLMMWINQVHVLRLVRQGILSREVGQPLIRALRQLEQEGTAGFTLDPRLKDLYFNLEHALIEKVGMDVGGRMHAGRSRNDLGATMHRLAVREALVDFMGLQFGLRACLLDKAAAHTGTVMPGYTHLQPAQPTTFGHYLASVALALERDAARLLDVYPRLNLNPLGACAFAGTGFPIDRALTAQWLGFDGLVDSTLDAVASRDYVAEFLAALAILGVTLSRLAQDLYLWCAGEWGMVEVADDVAMTSSIMPQKKNPITLEHIKAKAGHLLGALTSTLAVGVNFMHCRDMGEAVAPLWEALQQAQGVIHLTRRTVLGLRVNKALMLERATQDFSTATELADVLVREKGLPFRVAHGIVASLVTRVLQEGLAHQPLPRPTGASATHGGGLAGAPPAGPASSRPGTCCPTIDVRSVHRKRGLVVYQGVSLRGRGMTEPCMTLHSPVAGARFLWYHCVRIHVVSAKNGRDAMGDGGGVVPQQTRQPDRC